MPTHEFDENKCSAFLMKVLEHNAAAMTVFMRGPRCDEVPAAKVRFHRLF